ncbi:hypothetical protein [Thalassobaculum sp.]|uniref:hypothetical protein n=1 Tax=Thalassobaculum sp. TaxID=2022740 RepID=UPI003B5A26A6
MRTDQRSPVLAYLRRIDTKLDLLRDEMPEVKQGLTGVETALAGVHLSLDRLDVALERLEHHPALADA